MMAHSVLIVPAMDGSVVFDALGWLLVYLPMLAFGIGFFPIVLFGIGLLAKQLGKGMVELGLWAYRTHKKRAAVPAQSDVPLRSRMM